jgi:hypothetical protein
MGRIMESIVPDIMRMAERLVIVAGGILALFFGYRLFTIANLSSDSSAKVKAKVIEISATKIGPGIFFAAFGTYILWSAMTQPIVRERYKGGFLNQRDMLDPMKKFEPYKKDEKAAPPSKGESAAPPPN